MILISGRSAPRHKSQYPLNRMLAGSQSRSVSNDISVLSIVTIRNTISLIPFSPAAYCDILKTEAYFSKKISMFLPDYMLSVSKIQ